MADLTQEILTNREKYPDETPITLASGETTTVGQMRNIAQPRAEFTRASQQWSTEKRDLQAQIDAANQRLAEAISAKQNEPPAPAAAPAGGPAQYSDEDLDNDPIIGRLTKRLKQLEADKAKLEERANLHEQTWLRNQINADLRQINEHFNKTYNPERKEGQDFNQAEFLDWVQKNPYTRGGTVDLAVCYEQYTKPREVERIRKEARREGFDEGKKAAKVPTVPFGRRSTPARPAGVAEGKTFQQLSDDDIANDPDVQAAMRGEEG